MGKSQVALEYAREHINDYEAIFFLNAAEKELNTSMMELARKMGLAAQVKQDEANAQVKRWLQSHQNWLLIIENADGELELKAMREMLTSVFDAGSVLLTTQYPHPILLFPSPLPLKQFLPDDGALFLLHRAGLLQIEKALGDAPAALQESGRRLVEELGGLPLSLAQAAGFIGETGCSVDEYLRLYQDRENSPTLRREHASEEEHISVWHTFSIVEAFLMLILNWPSTTGSSY